MLHARLAWLPLALAISGGTLSAACSGEVIPEPTGGGSSSSGAGSSSGVSSSSSSGVTSSSSSSSGAGSSSGSPACSDLPTPALAEQCPDGSYTTGEYLLENGQCVLSFVCPPCEGPCTSPQPLPPQPLPTQPSPPYPPSPPACTAATPDACSSCLALPQICEVCADGTTECAHYILEGNTCATEICPGSTSPQPVPLPPQPVPPPGGGCQPGAACSPGEGCGTAEPAGSNACSLTCNCSSGGYFVCAMSCPPPVPEDAGVGIPGCSQGDPCMPGSGCGGGPTNGCDVSCNCNAKGYLDCTTTCPSTGVAVGPAQPI